MKFFVPLNKWRIHIKYIPYRTFKGLHPTKRMKELSTVIIKYCTKGVGVFRVSA